MVEEFLASQETRHERLLSVDYLAGRIGAALEMAADDTDAVARVRRILGEVLPPTTPRRPSRPARPGSS